MARNTRYVPSVISLACIIAAAIPAYCSPATGADLDAIHKAFAKKDAQIKQLQGQLEDVQNELDFVKVQMKALQASAHSPLATAPPIPLAQPRPAPAAALVSPPAPAPPVRIPTVPAATSAPPTAPAPLRTKPASNSDITPSPNIEVHATYIYQTNTETYCYTGTIENVGNATISTLTLWCRMSDLMTESKAASDAQNATAGLVDPSGSYHESNVPEDLRRLPEASLMQVVDSFRNMRPGETRALNVVVRVWAPEGSPLYHGVPADRVPFGGAPGHAELIAQE